jgi:nucleotide-binding universal stress UspA family protein
MMKTILVLAGGGESDLVVFETALRAAETLTAHLEFCHVRVPTSEALACTPHAGFAVGTAISHMIDQLKVQQDLRARAAALHFNQFCQAHNIELAGRARVAAVVSASWREEGGDAVRRLIRRARHNDLVVMARPAHANGLPPDLLELLLLGCGRPLLVATRQTPPTLTGTIMICWKETAEAARAVSAAMPFLKQAKRVFIVAAEEDEGASAADAAEVARQLGWHGISATAEFKSRRSQSASEVLAEAARTCDADLIVMGGYGRSRTRELIFGGVTRFVLDGGTDLPVLLVH